MQTVEYWLAIEWICEDCGRNNFSSMITPEFQEDEDNLEIQPWEDVKEALEEKLGIEPEDVDVFEGGALLCAPGQVVCKHCGSRFKIQNDPERYE